MKIGGRILVGPEQLPAIFDRLDAHPAHVLKAMISSTGGVAKGREEGGYPRLLPLEYVKRTCLYRDYFNLELLVSPLGDLVSRTTSLRKVCQSASQSPTSVSLSRAW